MSGSSLHPVALEIRGLRKTLTETAADDLALTIRAGKFYALLGKSFQKDRCNLQNAKTVPEVGSA